METCRLLNAALCAAVVFAFCPAAGAQQPTDPPRRIVTATRLSPSEQIVLDGRLNEDVWLRASPAADFVQIDPDNGTAASEATEVRIAFDRDTFYLGVTCFDSEPHEWLGYQRRRDEFLSSDDRFMWTIDTFLDARSGYFFEMNPAGLMADSLMGVSGDNRAWDGIWNARVHHSDVGWTIEIAIPFRTVNFDPNSDTWGINFQRTVRRKNEDSIWMGWARNQGLRRMTNAGHVTGITEVSQGYGLDIKPYGLVTSQSSPGRGERRMDGDGTAGVDIFYNPTPGLRTNLTINTDFAQTEVDQRQVNLTRFSLFFPERRDFFLDGATFFDFGSTVGQGGTDPLVNPFFSRRIGLSAGGTPQKIDFGTKITGQMGAQDVGLLHVRTGDDDATGMIGEDFTVGRVKRRMLRQSYLGAVYTRRDAPDESAGASHTTGVDLRLATSSFRGSQNLAATAWFLNAQRPGMDGHSSAWGALVEYPNDRWSARALVREVQRDFDPAVGFVTRRDYRRYSPQLAFGPRPRRSRYVRRFEFGGRVDLTTDLRNDVLERSVPMTLFSMELQSQDSIGIEAITTYERLDAPFAISQSITLPAGSEYEFARIAVRGQTANRRPVALTARIESGGFYSGQRDQSIIGVTLRLRPGYIVYLNGEWNSIRLKEGSFNTSLYRIVGETQFSPFIALVNNVQYDNVSRVVGWQSRFRWILRPGNDFYFVYTHNWLDDVSLDRLSTLDRRIASKILYTHRF